MLLEHFIEGLKEGRGWAVQLWFFEADVMESPSWGVGGGEPSCMGAPGVSEMSWPVPFMGLPHGIHRTTHSVQSKTWARKETSREEMVEKEREMFSDAS